MLERHVHRGDAIVRVEQAVDRLDLRQTDLQEILRPVVRRGHAERLGGEERRELDVVGADAQERRVLAHAAALHRAGHHDRGNDAASRSSIADSMNVCVPPPLSPVIATRDGSTSARLVDEVERADAVPRLQPHVRLQAQHGVGVGEALRDG